MQQQQCQHLPSFQVTGLTYQSRLVFIKRLYNKFLLGNDKNNANYAKRYLKFWIRNQDLTPTIELQFTS